MRLFKFGFLALFLGVAVLWGLANEPAPVPIPVTSSTDIPIVVNPSNPTPVPVQTSIHLLVTQALNLSRPLVIVGKPVQASFVVQNVGDIPLVIDGITVGVFDGWSWKPVPGANFPASSRLVLQPGQEFTFQAEMTYQAVGDYFAQPVVQSRGKWNPIPGGTRVWFEVDAK